MAEHLFCSEAGDDLSRSSMSVCLCPVCSAQQLTAEGTHLHHMYDNTASDAVHA